MSIILRMTRQLDYIMKLTCILYSYSDGFNEIFYIININLYCQYYTRIYYILKSTTVSRIRTVY